MRSPTFLKGETVRVKHGTHVLAAAWPGTWRIVRLWNTNTPEGFAADLERIDSPNDSGDEGSEGEEKQPFPTRRGTALVSSLERVGPLS